MSENENDEKMDEQKELEIVTGDGSELNFSPVYEHLRALKPKPKEEKMKKIIIPEVKTKKEPEPPEDDPEGNKVTIIMDDDTENNDINEENE